MFGLFVKRYNRIEIKNDSIFIDNKRENIGSSSELEYVFKLKTPKPEIKVYENNILIRTFCIDTLQDNPDLTGQFLHCSINILPNSAVMIDGIISNSNTSFSKWTDYDYEAVRFQPFYLSDNNDYNALLKGKGLFERGLHFNGKVTPTGVRNICICDNCNLSFTLQHFHAGFSEVQYFYSSDGSETLIIPYGAIKNLPVQLEDTIDVVSLRSVELALPKASNNIGTFKYYNALQCPHCLAPYINFEINKEIRSKEYYGNTYINKKPKYY